MPRVLGTLRIKHIAKTSVVYRVNFPDSLWQYHIMSEPGKSIAWKISAQRFTGEAGNGNSTGYIFHLSSSITSSETSLFSSESMICPEALLQSLLAAELSVSMQFFL